jgi:hypothetical protein
MNATNEHILHSEGERMDRKEKSVPLIAGGSLIGAVNGLLGGGGGMIAVPVLTRAAKLSPLRAHATAIAVILPASVMSGAVYLLKGLVPLSLFVPVALGVVSGGILGAKLLGVLPERVVETIFTLIMFLAGIRMIF